MDAPVICWPTYQVQRAPFTHLLGQHLFPITKFTHFPHRNVFSYSTKEKSSIHLKWVWNPSRILLASDCKNASSPCTLSFSLLLMLHLSSVAAATSATVSNQPKPTWHLNTCYKHRNGLQYSGSTFWWWPHFSFPVKVLFFSLGIQSSQSQSSERTLQGILCYCQCYWLCSKTSHLCPSFDANLLWQQNSVASRALGSCMHT